MKSLSFSHLNKLRSEFQKLHYEEQNVYLKGLLRRRQTKKTSGHPRKTNPIITKSGKRLGRPPAEGSNFSFEYSLRDQSDINVRVCQKAFCIVHGFGAKRLIVLRKKLEGGILQSDRRGKHESHPTVSEEIRQNVFESISPPFLLDTVIIHERIIVIEYTYLLNYQ